MSLILYLTTALLLLCLVHCFVRPVSKGAALVLLVIPMGLVGPALVTGDIYGPIDHLYQEVPFKASGPAVGIPFGARNASAIDIISEFFPWRRAVQASLQRGEWPLWNGYNLCGHPLASEAQSAPYSPFTLIACLLPAAVSLTYTAAMGLFLAALSAFLFARELDCGEVASLFAAAGWALSSSMVVYSLVAMGLTTVYMPLAFAATRRIVWRPGIASAAFLTVTLVLTTLQGHPESLFLNVLCASVYAVFELVRRRVAPWRAIGTAIAAGVVAVLLTAIFLLPILEAIPQSIEYHARSVLATAIHYGVPANQFLANLATDVFPHLHVRYWKQPQMGFIGVETAAVGSLVLAFAVYAVWRKRSAETWFFAVMALFCAIIGARWQPIVDALQHVPLMGITHHERLAFAAALSLVALAAFGVDTMFRRSDFHAASATLAGVFVFLATGIWWLSAHTQVMRTPADYGRYRRFSELFFLGATAVLLANARRARIVVPALLLLLVGQRWLAEGETFGTYPRELAFPSVPVFEAIKDVREPFRIVGRDGAFPPAYNTFYGFEDPRGYEALTYNAWSRTWKLWCVRRGIWFNRVEDLTTPFLSFLNVRYAIQADTLPVPPRWHTIATQPGALLMENEAVVDRIFVPARVIESTASPQELADRMAGIADFRELAYITSSRGTTDLENGPGRITLRSRSIGGRYTFDADMQRDGFVVISDTAWKGWRATIDDKRAMLYRANSAFLAVFVPAGHHTVRLRYLPRAFVIGRVISFAT
ncbi:MAG TPA: YfhO family protein, partial [Thermoanaerobaculia bacterium]|nr:YfhO family protein [Thermoanaerobaculia bacterium]